MIKDIAFTEGVESLINKGKNSEYAVYQTAMKFRQLFESLDDELMRARSADVLDINNRLIKILKGVKDTGEIPTEKFILICEELLPSEIMKFDKSLLAGIVTKYGSITSRFDSC